MKMPKDWRLTYIYISGFSPLVINHVDSYLCYANTVHGFRFINMFQMWNYGSLYPLYGKRVASFLIQLSIQVKPVCTRWKLVCQVKTRVPHGSLVARYFATQQICPRHTGFFYLVSCDLRSAILWKRRERAQREPHSSHTNLVLSEQAEVRQPKFNTLAENKSYI